MCIFMKQRIINILCAMFCLLPFNACASDNNSSETKEPSVEGTSGKTLVVYFSCTNTTKGIADHITNILSATEFRIEPSQPYTSADLNYSDNNCRANQEQNNNAARPAI